MNRTLDIGERFKFFRKKAQLTQKQIATIAGVTTPTICYIEGGHASPSVWTLKRVLPTLGVTFEELCDVTKPLTCPWCRQEIKK